MRTTRFIGSLWIIVLVSVLASFSTTDVLAQRKGSSSGYKPYKRAKAIDGDTYKYKGENIQIQKILPHRQPFLFVDKIMEINEDGIIGVKNISMNEDFFRGH